MSISIYRTEHETQYRTEEETRYNTQYQTEYKVVTNTETRDVPLIEYETAYRDEETIFYKTEYETRTRDVPVEREIPGYHSHDSGDGKFVKNRVCTAHVRATAGFVQTPEKSSGVAPAFMSGVTTQSLFLFSPLAHYR